MLAIWILWMCFAAQKSTTNRRHDPREVSLVIRDGHQLRRHRSPYHPLAVRLLDLTNRRRRRRSSSDLDHVLSPLRRRRQFGRPPRYRQLLLRRSRVGFHRSAGFQRLLARGPSSRFRQRVSRAPSTGLASNRRRSGSRTRLTEIRPAPEARVATR